MLNESAGLDRSHDRVASGLYLIGERREARTTRQIVVSPLTWGCGHLHLLAPHELRRFQSHPTNDLPVQSPLNLNCTANVVRRGHPLGHGAEGSLSGDSNGRITPRPA